MAVSKTQQAAVNRYVQKHYDRINVTMPKGKKETLQQHIDSTEDKSVNAFINRAIDETINRDNLTNTIP